MKNLLKLRFKQIKNRVKGAGLKKHLFFSLFGAGMLLLQGFFFIKIFGFLHREDEFPDFFKLFLSEKILMMVFLTLFSMLVLSALISTLNIFFLSKDLNLLFSSPLKVGTISIWKGIEVSINSALVVIFFSLPVLFAYCYYFVHGFWEILGILAFFLLYITVGVLTGIILGLIIPAFFSVRRLQPILSVVAIMLISLVVIFLRLLRPEQFGNPEVINNLVNYMAGLEVPVLAYFPFSWTARAFYLFGKGDYAGLLPIAAAFGGTILIMGSLIYFLQKKYYFILFDKLNKYSGGRYRSNWKKSIFPLEYGALLKKEVKTFMRTPAQWSQLLIIAAIIVVFILNMKGLPIPHPSFKNLISYLNLGMAAFIVAGLNSRFTFTAIPMENPGMVHLLAGPFDRVKIYRFKLLFYAVPQVLIGFFLFFTADISMGIDAFARFSGTIFLLPLLPFLTILAMYFSLRIEETVPLTPQHLLMSRSGISYMLWSMVSVVAGMVVFIRPLFLYYYSIYRSRPVPWGEIFTWFGGFALFFLVISIILYRKSRNLWLAKEYL